ncbi:hypothetical protein [Longimicrobium sp.]|uniref:hypothetical protein n=1 Tax=Longimicrobium sp. TaxID=2029185 RepID=UPI003B3AF6F5
MAQNYDALPTRLAAYAQQHPRMYRARAVALTMLGPGIVALLAAAVLINLVPILRPGVSIWAWVLTAVLGPILLEALSLSVPAPRGMVLARTEAPALWAEIERIRGAVGAPAPHQVLIGEEGRISVQQVPRLGVLGFYRTYLIIGLPLAAALTAGEFSAVLARELGLASGRGGRAGLWAWRAREAWTWVLEGLRDEREPTLRVFRAFVRWYAPFLDARTAVLRREHEFEADRRAARVAGPGALAAALCRLGVVERFLAQVFWPGVMRRTTEAPTPAPADVFRRILDGAPGAGAHPLASAWLADGVGHATQAGNPHPSLADRLVALDVTPALPPASAHPVAADVFLGGHAARLADRLGRKWAETHQYNWRKEQDEHLRTTQRLAELESRAAGEPLPGPEARERIRLTERLHGGGVAVPLIRGFLDAADDAEMRLLLGKLLLDAGDEAGLAHLKRAMSLDGFNTTAEACAAAARFLHARGRTADAEVFERRAAAHETEMARAAIERAARNVRPDDRFLPHELGDAELQAVIRHLSTVPGLKRALLVRKKVSVFPDWPCFVLVVVPVWLEGNGKSPLRLAPRVEPGLEMTGTVCILEARDDDRGMNMSVGSVPGAEIFRRNAPVPPGAR